MCKGPEAQVSVLCLRHSQKALSGMSGWEKSQGGGRAAGSYRALWAGIRTLHVPVSETGSRSCWGGLESTGQSASERVLETISGLTQGKHLAKETRVGAKAWSPVFGIRQTWVQANDNYI